MSHYFRARRTAAGFEVEGEPTCELGHRLPDGDGICAAWTWDGERLTVTNDRYGIYPVFYSHREGEIAVSSSLVELVRRGAPTELDEVALAVFRGLNYFVGDDTAFLHVKTVPPAARFAWDGHLVLEESEPRPIGVGPLAITPEEAEREYDRLLREAVERRLPTGDFALPLSGGCDSRHILFALLELGRPPALCATLARKFPPIDNTDLEIARTLAERLGMRHVVIPQLPRLEAELRKNVACHFLSDENTWYVAVADFLRKLGLPVYDGVAGDVLSAGGQQSQSRLAAARGGRYDEAAALLMSPGLPPGRRSDSFFLRSEELRSRARERVVRELERYAGSPNPISMFAFWNRCRRELALLPFAVGAGVTYLCPYLDHRLFDFLASLPSELTADKKFHDRAIAAAYPKLADVPYPTGIRGTSLLGSIPFTARVGWHGLRGDPRRFAGWAPAVARMALDNLLPAYHATHIVDGPAWHLYRWQLEELRRGNLPIRP